MARRKIVFVIVEGPSDDAALGYLLEQCFNPNETYVHIVHGDMTTMDGVGPENIVRTVGGCLKEFMASNPFKPKDFAGIIHIVDSDGAYVDDSFIEETPTARRFIYGPDKIIVPSKERASVRNAQKRRNLSKLQRCDEIQRIPYRIYYMSCNLDHVLYNKVNSTDHEKDTDSSAFALKYHDDINGFVEFICNSSFSVMVGYKESWDFLSNGCHSLERHTNLGLCLI